MAGVRRGNLPVAGRSRSFRTTGEMPSPNTSAYSAATGSRRPLLEGWTVIPSITVLIPEEPRPESLQIGTLVRPFVIAACEDTNTTLQCSGDWKLVYTGFRGSCCSLNFECKCGGTAKILALLTEGSWLLFSNANGVHIATEFVPGLLLKLSPRYKSVSMDLVVGDPSANPGKILTDFMNACGHETYISQLGRNRRGFQKQVRNYVENLKRR
jgi:hypothetical protein